MAGSLGFDLFDPTHGGFADGAVLAERLGLVRLLEEVAQEVSGVFGDEAFDGVSGGRVGNGGVRQQAGRAFGGSEACSTGEAFRSHFDV